MKTTILVTMALLLAFGKTQAQQFIDKAVVEYEVKTNVKKTMGNNSWDEQLKDAMSQFKTGYYTYTFAGNKSVYKFDHWAAGMKIPEWFRRNDEENVWFFDHNAGKYNMQKQIYGTSFNLEDSIRKIEWKFSNESRMIAGFNCRKATGKIMDSVYVFAFYTDEITISGGPVSISGLPGLVMGLTIPRLYTSYIATKVMVNNVPVASIKPVASKKYMTNKNLFALLQERSRDWGSSDDEDGKQWLRQFIWNAML